MELTSFDDVKFSQKSDVQQQQKQKAQIVSKSPEAGGLFSSLIKKVKTVLQPSSSATVPSTNVQNDSNKLKPETNEKTFVPVNNQLKILGFVGYSASLPYKKEGYPSDESRPASNSTDYRRSSSFSSRVPSRLGSSGKKKAEKENLLLFNEAFDPAFVQKLNSFIKNEPLSAHSKEDISSVDELDENPGPLSPTSDSQWSQRRKSSSNLSTITNSGSKSLFKRLKFGQSDLRRDYWMRDEISKECYQCKLPFTTFRRRHHCRVCGQVFCGKCANETIPAEKFGLNRDIRVCDYCYKMAMEYQLSESFDYGPETTNQVSTIDYSSVPVTLQQWAKNYDSTISTFSSSRKNSLRIANQGTENSYSINSFDSLRRFFNTSQSFIRLFNNNTSNSNQTLHPSQSVYHESLNHAIDKDLPFRTNAEEEELIVESEDENDVLLRKDSKPRQVSSEAFQDQNSSNVQSDSLVYFLSTQNRNVKRRRRTDGEKKASMFLSVDLTKNVSGSLSSLLNPELDAAKSPSASKFPFLNKPSVDDSSIEILRNNQIDQKNDIVISPEDSVPLLHLNSSSLEFIRQFVKQLLSHYNLPKKEDWEEEIVKLMMKVCFNVRPKVKQGADIDIRQSIRVKKLPGGYISETNFVCGVVFTKNVMHKHMLGRQVILNPRILLLSFPLQYERHQERRFTSLEPVMQQEGEYIRSIIQRIYELRPDVILCSSLVSRVALDYLLQHNIVCVSNVKISIMEDISRCTGAEICKSLDKITLSHESLKLGTCGKFYVKTFLLQEKLSEGQKSTQRYKSLMFFDEGIHQSRCTILVRGSEYMMLLKKVKKIIHLMSLISYNLTLESSFLREQQKIVSYDFNPVMERLSNEEGSLLANFLLPYRSVVLSISPGVRFPEPYLLHQMVAKEMEIRASQDDSSTQVGILESVYQQFKTFLSTADFSCKFKCPPSLHPDIELGLNYIINHADHQLTPYRHQNILILYCNINIYTQVPCFPPDIHVIEYYNKQTDMTLGQYLEELCFDSKFKCPAQCHEKNSMLMHHYRSYIHSEYRLDVRVNSTGSPLAFENDVIYNYLYCKRCDKIITPLVPISENTWNYSLGKFLELKFYSNQKFTETCITDRCEHSGKNDIIDNFILNNLSVTFNSEKITLFELVRPPLLIDTESLFELKESNCDAIRESINKFFNSVEQRLLNLEQLFEKLVDFSSNSPSFLSSFESKVYTSKSSLLSLLLNRFIESDDNDLLGINRVRINLYMAGLEWDSVFVELARKFVALLQEYLGNQRIFKIYEEGEKLDCVPTVITSTQLDAIMEENQNFNMKISTNDLIPGSPTIDKRLSLRHSVVLNELEGDIRSADVKIMKNMKLSITSEDNGSPLASPKQVPLIRVDSPSKDLDVISEQGNEKSKIPKTSENAENSKAILDKIVPDPNMTLKNMKELLNQASQQGLVPSKLIKNPSSTLSSSGLGPIWSSSGSQPVISLLPGSDSSILFDCFDFKPLDYGVLNTEHYLLDSPIVIRETEPTSIIACTLSSRHYLEELKQVKESSINTDSVYENELEKALLSKSGSHVKYEFQVGGLKCSCRAYFAEQFDAVRKLTNCDKFFVQSLSRCSDYKTKGGQSGSHFFKTEDDRFILKQLSKPEMEAFLGFATSYFSHLHQVFYKDLPSTLVKLLGVYRIAFKNTQEPGASATATAVSSMGLGNVRIDLVVMENLFYKKHMRRIFDLKGSMRNRHVQSTGSQDEVLLDENLMEIMGLNPLFIREHSKKILRASVWNDTLFLSRQNVMDYSLLVGIEDESSELIIGIVDFIRTFTWDKKLESWVKETGILGGGGKEPTIVSPKLYKNRFREAMEKYFLMVPDKFCDINSVLGAYDHQEHEKVFV